MTSSNKLLVYCVAEGSPRLTDLRGLEDEPVRQVELQRLVLLYSDFSTARPLNPADALRFHAALRSVFDQQAIIPFRFPTFLESEAELKSHLQQNHAKYAADLARLREFVQMEVRISAVRENNAPSSGKEYLEGKLQQSRSLQEAVQAIRDPVADLTTDCKERQTDQGVRLFTLTKRPDVAAFRERISRSQPSTGFTIAVSGPWPATEFFHE